MHAGNRRWDSNAETFRARNFDFESTDDDADFEDDDEHAIEEVARYVGEASVDCVRTKYESKGKPYELSAKDRFLGPLTSINRPKKRRRGEGKQNDLSVPGISNIN
ncbi:hypothetical protein L1987_48138 [Smallanthus sonchifolius]|uniref:Uncharacterized protein n=1 Tax=Smallanthus sonchifolius TaxID=185202 RepID=A0ACB9FRR5_9ASTR|nr:hypothetical protein L1987_48138 [Smallanthus sonchifolius]